MSVIEQVSVAGRAVVQSLVDKEPVNYIEAGSLYGIITIGRYHVALLTVLHNHAQDPQLKVLIKEAMDTLSEVTLKKCEHHLKSGGAKMPSIEFPERSLQDRVDIPGAARLSDREIALTLAGLDASSQLSLLTALHQCYQLEIALTLRTQLSTALDWSYRLLQLMLHRGWLPEIAKVTH